MQYVISLYMSSIGCAAGKIGAKLYHLPQRRAKVQSHHNFTVCQCGDDPSSFHNGIYLLLYYFLFGFWIDGLNLQVNNCWIDKCINNIFLIIIIRLSSTIYISTVSLYRQQDKFIDCDNKIIRYLLPLTTYIRIYIKYK